MAINGSVVKAATTLGTTGGTDLTFTEIGGARAGTTRVAPTSDTVAVSRRTAEFTATPAPLAPGSNTGYGKERRVILVRFPREVSTGVYEVATYRVEIAEPVTTTAADQLESRKVVSQMLFDSDFTSFFDSGAQS